jgi:hypothetical protein
MGPWKWARKRAAYACCQLGAMGANPISTTKTTMSCRAQCRLLRTHAFTPCTALSLFFCYSRFYFRRSETRLSNHIGETGMDDRSKLMGIGTFACWLAVGRLDTFFVLFFWDEIPSLLVYLDKVKLAKGASFKYHGMKTNCFSFDLYIMS